MLFIVLLLLHLAALQVTAPAIALPAPGGWASLSIPFVHAALHNLLTTALIKPGSPPLQAPLYKPAITLFFIANLLLSPPPTDTLLLTSPFYQEAAIITKPLRLVGAAAAPGCAGGRATLFQQRPPVVLAQDRCAAAQGPNLQRLFACSNRFHAAGACCKQPARPACKRAAVPLGKF